MNLMYGLIAILILNLSLINVINFVITFYLDTPRKRFEQNLNRQYSSSLYYMNKTFNVISIAIIMLLIIPIIIALINYGFYNSNINFLRMFEWFNVLCVSICFLMYNIFKSIIYDTYIGYKMFNNYKKMINIIIFSNYFKYVYSLGFILLLSILVYNYAFILKIRDMVWTFIYGVNVIGYTVYLRSYVNILKAEYCDAITYRENIIGMEND